MEKSRTTLDVPLCSGRELHDAELQWSTRKGVETNYTPAIFLIRGCAKPNASAVSASSPFTFTK